MSHDIRIAGTDAHFPCEPGQNILDAALRAGIEMPYSCRKGVCGNCAARVTGGDVACPPAATPLEAGLQLLCQCTPLGDVEIAPSTWHRLDRAARRTFAAKVYRNTLAAPDVSVLQLRLPAGQRAKFKAGQYLQLELPDGSRRCYSMANPPHERDALQLHVRHVPGGAFSGLVARLTPGDVLRVELPYGSFELGENAPAPMLCVAGGTGFAPVKSLIDDLARKKTQRPVTLVWGGRDRAGLYLLDWVDRWRAALPRFRFIAALEDAADAAALQAFHGRVDAAVRSTFDTLAGFEVYCCGAPAMVLAVKQACVQELGVAPQQFFSDSFAPGPAAR